MKNKILDFEIIFKVIFEAILYDFFDEIFELNFEWLHFLIILQKTKMHQHLSVQIH